jgi:pilus assembly protein CpaB
VYFEGAGLLRPIIVIPAAIVLFLVAAVLLWNGFHSQGTKPSDAALSASSNAGLGVVVANTDIVAGQVLSPGDISLHSEDSAHTPPTALRQVGDAQGHMALIAIHAGEPVLRASVSDNAVLGIAPRVPVGYRAYAIPVNEADIAGGFLQVGDHVDLYVTLPGALFGDQSQIGMGRKPDDQSKSTLLLPGVNVLAVGQKLQTNGTADTSVRTVTVALASDTLAKIALAERLGTITFAIRNPIDAGQVESQTATLSSLVGTTTAPPPPARRSAAAQGGGITVYAGRDRSVVRVP